MSYTKPKFKDCSSIWKIEDNGIIFNDDGEHIIDTFYNKSDAVLIRYAPLMYEILKKFDIPSSLINVNEIKKIAKQINDEMNNK